MFLWLGRYPSGTKATLGELFVDGVYQCDTLEDVVRDPGVKIPGQTAIPFGTYEVTIDFSPHFNRMMPHVLDVPNFDGIRIHWGNTDADTEGCILLGKRENPDFIDESVATFNAFFTKLQAAINAKEDVQLSIDHQVTT